MANEPIYEPSKRFSISGVWQGRRRAKASPKPKLAHSIAPFTDTCGSPSQSYDLGRLRAIRSELVHQLGIYLKIEEISVAEIIAIERRVKKELYG